MIEWIVTSSALILLVMLLRVLIKGRVNPRLRYALWGLVLLRLLIPGTLWESRASVLTPMAERENVRQNVIQGPDAVYYFPDFTRGSQPYLDHVEPETAAPPAEEPAFALPGEVRTEGGFLPEKPVDWRALLAGVWLAGCGGVGAVLAAVNLRFALRLKRQRRRDGIFRGRRVFVIERLPSPCLFGVLRPAVCLTPEVAEDTAARGHVLAHEYAHFRQGDHIWAALRGVCLALHWYNPLVWLAAYLSRRDCELSCDEGAVRILGEEARAEYGRTLVGLVARRTTVKDLACCATTMTGGRSALKERIALLVKRPRTTAWMACAVAAACVLFVVCTFTGAAVEEPGQDEDAPEAEAPADDGLLGIGDLPASLDWDADVWLLRKIQGEDIALYQVRETGVNYLRRGNYLQELKVRNLYGGEPPVDLEMVLLDPDGGELAITYRVPGGERRELLLCRWDGREWTEYQPRDLVGPLARDFEENYQVSVVWEDPGMGETAKPSVLSVEWNGTAAAVEAGAWLSKTGGRLVCELDGERYSYCAGRGGISLVIQGGAWFEDSPVENSFSLRYVCPVVCWEDGSFECKPGVLAGPQPENLPEELMDLDRPAEEQGNWLLLAQVPMSSVSLYRSAWDDRHVYLKDNQCFQCFDQDISGMELLPTMKYVDNGGELTVQILYRRYEGTYFNGREYEPGIVADAELYDWNARGNCWELLYSYPQSLPLQTEDLPALADLPGRLVRPGTPEAEADMWLIGEIPEADISVYYEQSTGKTWLRYGDMIQAVEGMTVCMPQMLLPELHWADLDGDGDRELAAISVTDHGTGVSVSELTVCDWDGQRWTWTTHDQSGLIEDFNSQRVYEFYADGTAFIKYGSSSVLLDLSALWRNGYWDGEPDICELNRFLTHYTYQDGQITLTVGGWLQNSAGGLFHNDAFEYVCPIPYTEYGDREGYLISGSGVLRSDFTVEQEPPELSDVFRAILAKRWDECDKYDHNVFAVFDVNGDGEDELIVRWMPEGAVSSGWGTSVYNAFGSERFHGHGELTFYSNGAVSEPWSHNQGQASAIWPYRLYQYTPGRGYAEAGSARAISSERENFPRRADLDGDGMVYFIGEDAYTEENAVDNAVYEAWRDRYLGGAQVLPVMYFALENAVS